MKGLRDGQRWAYDFFFGEYRGSPIDYVMALAIVFAMMGVVITKLLGQITLPEPMVSFAVPMIKMLHQAFFP